MYMFTHLVFYTFLRVFFNAFSLYFYALGFSHIFTSFLTHLAAHVYFYALGFLHIFTSFFNATHLAAHVYFYALGFLHIFTSFFNATHLVAHVYCYALGFLHIFTSFLTHLFVHVYVKYSIFLGMPNQLKHTHTG